MTKEELINSIRNAEYFIEQNAPYYHAMESECPDSFKFLTRSVGRMYYLWFI